MPRTVIAFLAHPDDEFHCLGTLIRLAGTGDRVVLAPATNGDKGLSDPSITPEQLVAIRRRETETVRQMIGAEEVVWLGFEDGALELHQAALRRAVQHLVERVRPDVVFTHDPWRRWELHSDHRVIGFTVADALAERVEGESHGTAGAEAPDAVRLYFFHSETPNHWVDIESVFEQKLQAAQAHISQRRAGTLFDTRVEKARAGEAIEGHELLREGFRSSSERGPLE